MEFFMRSLNSLLPLIEGFCFALFSIPLVFNLNPVELIFKIKIALSFAKNRVLFL